MTVVLNYVAVPLSSSLCMYRAERWRGNLSLMIYSTSYCQAFTKVLLHEHYKNKQRIKNSRVYNFVFKQNAILAENSRSTPSLTSCSIFRDILRFSPFTADTLIASYVKTVLHLLPHAKRDFPHRIFDFSLRTNIVLIITLSFKHCNNTHLL